VAHSGFVGWVAMSRGGSGRFLGDSGDVGVWVFYFIFQSIFQNATKHRKRNYFPSKHLHLKTFYIGKYFTIKQTKPKIKAKPKNKCPW
jgi:hypothetical protein